MNERKVGIVDMKNDPKMTCAKLRFLHSTSGQLREQSLFPLIKKLYREYGLICEVNLVVLMMLIIKIFYSDDEIFLFLMNVVVISITTHIYCYFS